MLRRGEVQGGPSKITIPVLAGNKARDVMGLIDRILKRTTIVKHLFERFTMNDDAQKALVQKFVTFTDYDKNLPIVDRTAVGDLTWMSSRSPACAAVTNLMKRIWDGEMDEHIRAALKSTASMAPLDWIQATDMFNTAYKAIEHEWGIAHKGAALAAAPGVSAGAEGYPANGAATAKELRDQARAEDPEAAQLWTRAAFRRAETCCFLVGDASVAGMLVQMKDSCAAKQGGTAGSKHIAVVGDFGVLPDATTRPWVRPPLYTSNVCSGRMNAGREFFEMDGNDHVIMVYFDTTREGNRAPIRKCIELADQNIGKQGDGKDSRTREFSFRERPALARTTGASALLET